MFLLPKILVGGGHLSVKSGRKQVWMAHKKTLQWQQRKWLSSNFTVVGEEKMSLMSWFFPKNVDDLGKGSSFAQKPAASKLAATLKTPLFRALNFPYFWLCAKKRALESRNLPAFFSVVNAFFESLFFLLRHRRAGQKANWVKTIMNDLLWRSMGQSRQQSVI